MFRHLVVGIVALAVLASGLALGPDVVATLSDLGRVKGAILALGSWAPLGLIVLSAVQIVVAPIPGYLVQIAGGYLFGPWAGGVYGIAGMLVGAAVAFVLGRRLGVPLLERLMPARLLEKWLHLRNLNSATAWLIILLLPVGDFCYFLAGLTALSLSRMLAVTLLVRGPTVFVAAFVGAKAALLPQNVLWVVLAGVVVTSALVLWRRDRLELAAEAMLERVLGKRENVNGGQGGSDDH